MTFFLTLLLSDSNGNMFLMLKSCFEIIFYQEREERIVGLETENAMLYLKLAQVG